jgi:hypothetical protein
MQTHKDGLVQIYVNKVRALALKALGSENV